MATRVVLLMALSLSILPALIPVATAEFRVKGCVYCDTCRAGFETNVTTYIEGARVRVQCKDRKSLEIVFYAEGVTESTGTYNIVVKNDHQDHICESVLLSSPLAGCNTPDPGRNKASIVLTRYNNGILNDLQYANAMGYLKDEPLPGCRELIKYYLSDV